MSNHPSRPSKTVHNKPSMLKVKVGMIAQWIAVAKLTSRASFLETISAAILFWFLQPTTFRMHHSQIWALMLPIIKDQRTTGSHFQCRALISPKANPKAKNKKVVPKSTGREASLMPSARAIIVINLLLSNPRRQAVVVQTLTTFRKSAKCNNRCSNNSNSATGALTRVH